MESSYIHVNRVIFLFLLAIASFEVQGQSSQVQLKLNSATYITVVNQKVELSLEIIDPNLPQLISESNIVSASFFKDQLQEHAFTYKFFVELPDTGDYKFGPYKIKYRGSKLLSNQISIKAIERKDAEDLYFDLPASVSLNAVSEIKIRGNSELVKTLILDESDHYKVVGSSDASSYVNLNGVERTDHTKIFRVQFVEIGVIEFNKESFLNFPKHLILEAASLEVR